MKYLLDTNVVCEPIRPKPNQTVLNWFRSVPEYSLFISVLTIGEIWKGIEMTEGRKRQKLESWFRDVLCPFHAGRTLPVDEDVARQWGSLIAKSRRTLSAIDSLLAATALHHDLTIVTRNDTDFALSNLSVVNPWRE